MQRQGFRLIGKKLSKLQAVKLNIFIVWAKVSYGSKSPSMKNYSPGPNGNTLLVCGKKNVLTLTASS